MEVILKQTVEKLGEAGAVVKVADGYARNFLMPKGLAVQATKQNRVQLDQEKAVLDQRKNKELKEAQALGNKIRSFSCTFKRQAGEQDKLFGSVTSQDIAEFLAANGVEIDRRKIELEEPLKTLGVHRVAIHVHPELSVELKVKIQKEE